MTQYSQNDSALFAAVPYLLQCLICYSALFAAVPYLLLLNFSFLFFLAVALLATSWAFLLSEKEVVEVEEDDDDDDDD